MCSKVVVLLDHLDPQYYRSIVHVATVLPTRVPNDYTLEFLLVIQIQLAEFLLPCSFSLFFS